MLRPITILLVIAVTCSAAFGQHTWAADGNTSKRHALVVGVGDYTHIGKLINPVNDASAIGGVLEKLGYKTKILPDPNRAELDRAMEDFILETEGADAALFFYAGHGFQFGEVNYLLPVDFNAAGGTLAINLSSFVGRLKSRVKIIVLDACRDDPRDKSSASLGRQIAVLNAQQSVTDAVRGERGYATMTAPPGTFIAFATAPGAVASDGPNMPNSPFTMALLSVIDKPGLAVSNLLDAVRSKMISDAAIPSQVPWSNSSLFSDFYIVPLLDWRSLVKALHSMLIDLKCFSGKADEDWTDRSRRAIQRFNKTANVVLDQDNIKQGMLHDLSVKFSSGVRCPVDTQAAPQKLGMRTVPRSAATTLAKPPSGNSDSGSVSGRSSTAKMPDGRQIQIDTQSTSAFQ